METNQPDSLLSHIFLVCAMNDTTNEKSTLI